VIRLFKALPAIVCTALLTVAAQGFPQEQAQEAQQGQAQGAAKNWKDRGEYDLYVAITKETDANKQVALLNEWKQKYPQTDYSAERYAFLLAAYQKAGQPAKIVETARAMVAEDPKSFQGLYWITFLAPTLGDSSPGFLDEAKRAAQAFNEGLDTVFTADKKPAQLSEAQWKTERDKADALAHKTMGWVAMQNKNNEEAEKHLKESVQLNPAQGDVSYWLGTVILNQRKPETQDDAMFHFARAAAYEGEGALNPQGRQQVRSYLEKIYTTYHGSKDGLDQVIAQARQNPLPPPDFDIKTKAQLDIERANRLKEENPQLALWMGIRDNLTGNDDYFESSLKNAALPKLKGTVISATPERRPTQVVIGLMSDSTAEVTLKVDSALPGPAPAGTEIEFEGGVPTEFTKEPFNLVLNVERGKISGWPAPAAPAKAKAPGKAKRR
jgi:tetratricopeptide (TPR) repeat protein